MRVIPVYRCPTCRAVYDYDPRHHPAFVTDRRWVRHSPYWGRLEGGRRVPGCLACGYICLLYTSDAADE